MDRKSHTRCSLNAGIGLEEFEKPVNAPTTTNELPICYVSTEDTIDIKKRAHIFSSHRGKDCMLKGKPFTKYANVTKQAMAHFRSCCIEGQCNNLPSVNY